MSSTLRRTDQCRRHSNPTALYQHATSIHLQQNHHPQCNQCNQSIQHPSKTQSNNAALPINLATNLWKWDWETFSSLKMESNDMSHGVYPSSTSILALIVHFHRMYYIFVRVMVCILSGSFPDTHLSAAAFGLIWYVFLFIFFYNKHTQNIYRNYWRNY